MDYNEIDGDLIELALDGKFDAIAHGVNCMCTQKSGIAPQMVKAFNTDKYDLENPHLYKGDINKLGQIEHFATRLKNMKWVSVVNAYTQYNYGKNHIDGSDKPLDYQALTLCMRKMNNVFKGQHIGLPRIGAGLAGGDWDLIKFIIQDELKDCKITVVNYKP